MAIIKGVVLGDSEVGKTSFTSRWTQGSFPNPEMLKTTVGAAFDTKKITLPSGTDITLSLWDFGGQRRFIEALKSMIIGAKVGLFFFDTTHLASLDSLYNYWVSLAQQHGNFDFMGADSDRFILVGNKIDLLGNDFEKVNSEMAFFTKRFGIETALISAKTGLGIEQLDFKFKEMCEKVL
ncbi:MAG: GTP-binding protein [Candidatus Thorarchaeota archaeon]|nr:MAG: GTP-binding protein [Candidatus Thorarchaeota archaeon]